MDKELRHVGTPRHSGRYPWGSGEDPEQRNKSFLGRVEELKNKGLTEKEIADGMNMTTSQLRAKKSIAKTEQRKADVAQAVKLKNKGYSNIAIGERMGVNESTVRSWLNPVLQERSEITNVAVNMLKEQVDKKSYIDVGVGVERYMGISRTRLMTAISQLEEEGYRVHKFDIEQLGTGKRTNMMVLTKDDVTYPEILKNKDKIRLVTDYSEDGGRSFLGLETPRSVDSKRVLIKYAEDGGINKDGVIELRRGVEEISLGNAKYAQVRIAVDGTHYMKGMAIYNDDMPPGVDIMYNTNKSRGTPKEKVFKEMKNDPDNPFGATVRQKHFITDEGKKIPGSDKMLDMKTKGLSYTQIAEKMNVSEDLVRKAISVKALNIINEEGEWRDKWSKNLSSQMLSKQTPALAKKQLGLAYDIKKEEFDEIVSLTNPAVKKRLLDSFSDDCDSAAVHLKSAALPRTGWHALLPIPSMKENEVYAPNYRDGESVVLIRYPHGGRFEIPELRVNNKQKDAKNVMDRAADAIGIHPKVAERLSGADFDGDAVLVIPNTNKSVKTADRLKGLIDFDPKASYKPYDGMVTIDGGIWREATKSVDYGKDEQGRDRKPITRTKQMKMGDVSNLITDMTIRGANPDDIAAAVRHSMVVIDAEKHSLDYKKSYIDNNIAGLKKRYQGSERSGASTLISKASSEQRVGVRKEKVPDKITGKKIYEYTNETYTDANGKIHPRTIKSTKMAEVDDAFKLSSGTPMESVYATHANKLKALANEARKESVNTKPTLYSPSAKKTYAPEVASLNAKLNVALKNAPLERQAQLLANSVVSAKKAANPNMDAADVKKIKGQALTEARNRVNSHKERVEITDREWEAIQAGAISTNTLNQILSNTELSKIKQLATPRSNIGLSPAKQAKAKAMLSSGYTQSEVADALGVSTTTLAKVID